MSVIFVAMKKYFAKWLPVDGKLEEGCNVLYEGEELQFPKGVYKVLDNVKEHMSVASVGGFGIRHHRRSYQREDGKTVNEGAYLKIGYNILPKDVQKVKLFICTSDIVVSDKDCYYIDVTQNNKVVRTPENWEIETIGPEPDGHIAVKFTNNTFLWIEEMFKVIGELSKYAIWVKEGDEFGEDELKIMNISEYRRKMTPSLPECVVKVKCSNCKTFH